MNSRFLKQGEKKKLVSELKEEFGIERVKGMLIETGKQKVRLFTGTMTREEIAEFGEIANVEFVGLYVFKKEDNFLRLSFDGSFLFGKEIKKNVFVLNDEQLNDWMNGKNIDIFLERGIYVVKYGDDSLGCGVSDGKRLINFVPKERRVSRS